MSLLSSRRARRARRNQGTTGQSHLDLWEGDGEAHPGNHFQVHEGQRCVLELSAWVYEGEIVLEQLDKLL